MFRGAPLFHVKHDWSPHPKSQILVEVAMAKVGRLSPEDLAKLHSEIGQLHELRVHTVLGAVASTGVLLGWLVQGPLGKAQVDAGDANQVLFAVTLLNILLIAFLSLIAGLRQQMLHLSWALLLSGQSPWEKLSQQFRQSCPRFSPLSRPFGIIILVLWAGGNLMAVSVLMYSPGMNALSLWGIISAISLFAAVYFGVFRRGRSEHQIVADWLRVLQMKVDTLDALANDHVVSVDFKRRVVNALGQIGTSTVASEVMPTQTPSALHPAGSETARAEDLGSSESDPSDPKNSTDRSISKPDR